MKRRFPAIVLFCLAVMGMAGVSQAQPALTIHQIQSETSDGDASSYVDQTRDVIGGVVTHKWDGFNDRVYLQVPGETIWGGIPVKDVSGDLLSQVAIGDWINFGNIEITESRGTTFLQWDSSLAEPPTVAIESSGNDVPDPLPLTAAHLKTNPTSHAVSEQYESMVVTLTGPTIGELGLGKASDNYELWQGTDIAWGADYMNVDKVGDYHPYIPYFQGQELDSITGVVEQYLRDGDPGWDYYQLLTRSGADIVPEPGTVSLMLAGLVLVVRRRRRS